jgi:hypothetical protein
MDVLPRYAKRCQVFENRALDAGQVAGWKPVVLPERNGTRRAIQLEDSFVPVSNDVYMCRTMVIWVNGHPQSANPQNGWQEAIIS